MRIILQRQLYDFIRGLGDASDIDVRIDGKRVRTVTVGGGDHGTPAPISYGGDYGVAKGTSEQWETYRLKTGDAQLEVVVPVAAGTRTVGVSFVTRNYELEGVVQPGPTGFQFSVDESLSSAAGREEPGIDSVEIFGPYKVRGAGETSSRKRLFVCQPRPAAEEIPCATKILAATARRAYRRPVTDSDIASLLAFYRTGSQEGGFERGIQEALTPVSGRAGVPVPDRAGAEPSRRSRSIA